MDDVLARLSAWVRKDPALVAFTTAALVVVFVLVFVWGLPRWLLSGTMVPYLISLLARFKWTRRPMFEPFAEAKSRSGMLSALYGLGARGYRVFPRVRTDAGFVDVLMIGPTGVFTVRTSAPDQEVVPDNQGRDALVTESADRALARAEAERASVERMLRERGLAAPVRGLIAKVGKGSHRWTGGSAWVDFIAPELIAERVTYGPVVLEHREVDRCLHAVLDVESDPAGSAPDPAPDR